MDIQKKLEELDKDLSTLHKTSIKQMLILNEDDNTIYKHILELGTKHPEYRDVLEFIIYINDSLSRRDSDFENIMSESMMAFIDVQKSLIDINIEAEKKIRKLHSKKSFWQIISTKITSINDIKTILGVGFVLVFVILKVWFPEASSEVFGNLIEILLPTK